MAATLLQTCKEFAGRRGLPIPTSVMGSTDASVIQFLRTLEEECIALAARGPWQTLINEYTFTALGAESQGTISAGFGSTPVALNGYRYMLPEILWDRTSRIPICGSLDPQTWAYLKTMGIVGPYSQFRFRGDQLITIPALTVGHTIAFEYITSNFVNLAGVTSAGASRFVNDTDTIRLQDDIVLAGMTWRWLKTKGFAYAEDFNSYEDAVKDQLARERPGRTLNLAGGYEGFRPSITIPLMSTIPP
jgi:hypothetical protein